MSDSISKMTYPTWINEIYYTKPESIGHIIGKKGFYVKKLFRDFGCKVIIDKEKKSILIIGQDELSVYKVTVKVQEKLLISWKYIEINFHKEKDSIIRDLSRKIKKLESEFKLLTSQIKDKDDTIYKLKFPTSPKMRYIEGYGMVYDNKFRL